MSKHVLRRVAATTILAAMLAVPTACGRTDEAEPPVATVTFSSARTRVPLGSPLEVTYRFAMAPSGRFDKNYKVFVHFVNSDDEQMWTDDHDPPRPTTSWKPGETVEYTRTVFVPIYPYIGQARVVMGLYAPGDGSRPVLAGADTGQRAYTVGTLELLPQSENVFLIFKDGWHPAEFAPDNTTVEWKWTKRKATISFRNPKQDVLFFLQLDGRPDLQPVTPQPVTLSVGGQVVDSFTLSSGESVLRKVPIAAAQLGTGDSVELTIDAGSSFVPAETPAAKSSDPRELGVRVFQAFVQPV